MRKIILTPEQQQEIIYNYVNLGLTQLEVIKKLSISEKLVRRCLNEHNWGHRRRFINPNPPIGADISHAICRDYKYGYKVNNIKIKPSMRDLARKYKIADSTVARIVRHERQTFYDKRAQVAEANAKKEISRRTRVKKLRQMQLYGDKGFSNLPLRPHGGQAKLKSDSYQNDRIIKTRNRINHRISRKDAINIINSAAKGISKESLKQGYKISQTLMDIILRYPTEIKQGKQIP